MVDDGSGHGVTVSLGADTWNLLPLPFFFHQAGSSERCSSQDSKMFFTGLITVGSNMLTLFLVVTRYWLVS